MLCVFVQNSPRISPTQSTPSPSSNPTSPSYLQMATAFAIDPSSELSHGECSPTSLYQNLQTLHLQPTAPAAATVTATALQRPQFPADAMFRPDEQYVNGPYACEVVGPSFTMDTLPLGGVSDELQPGPSSAYGCGTVPLTHPNLQIIREDVASSQGTVSDSGSRSDTPQSHPQPTVSPPHPVISVTDALGRVMPVVMVTQGDAPTSADAMPMDDSAGASLVDFPAGYFAGYNYSGNYAAATVGSDPLDLSSTCAALSTSHSNDSNALCSTIIRTQRSARDLYCDLSQVLETSSAKELVQRCDVDAGLFFLANASVSLEVRVSHGPGDDRGIDKAGNVPRAALCFRHLAGDVVLYDGICRELVSRLSL